MDNYRVGCLIGSLSSASINRKLATALIKLAPPELTFTEIRFGDLPLYNYELDKNLPVPVQAFKAALDSVEAVLFVTPEYNRSIPGPLKNAIDWGTRPYGQNSFARKATAIIGVSTGKIGTAIAQQHLRSILAFCNAPLMNTIEAYIHFEKGMITDDGAVTNDATRDFLRNYIEEFCSFVTRVYAAIPKPARS